MRRNLLILLAVVTLGLLFPLQTLAQDRAVWDVAETITDLTFDAQLSILAGEADEASQALDEAIVLYETHLQSTIASVDASVDTRVTEGFSDAQTAIASGDPDYFAAARAQINTGLYAAGYVVTLDALDRGDAQTADEWQRLRLFRAATKVNIVENPSAAIIDGLADGEVETGIAAQVVRDDFHSTYTFRFREALLSLEDAAANEYGLRSAEWATLAQGYYLILQSDYADKRGAENDASMLSELETMSQVALDEDWQATNETIAAVDELLLGYQPVALDEAALADRAQLLYTFTDLVWIEYRDGVRNGQITIEIEYREAITFRDQAQNLFEELQPQINEADPAAVDRLTTLYAEIDTIIADKGPRPEVEIRIEEALELLAATLPVDTEAGGTVAFAPINVLLDEVLVAVEAGDYELAEQKRIEAYALFETGPEARLANRALLLSREIEGLFWEGSGGERGLFTLIAQEASPEELEANLVILRERLVEAEDFLSAGLTGPLAAVNSFAIILREGLEAVLIVGAIIGYMRATEQSKRYANWVVVGVVGAIVLSIATWFVSISLINITAASRELIEGVTSLIAVVVLFFVTNWLFHKVYVVDWMKFVKDKVGQALTTGSALGLAGLGFTVVYREGFETVLFYQALLFDADPLYVIIGFAVGSVVIAILTYVILGMSVRLPLKPFFTVTSILLLILAFGFTGSGIRELQEAGVFNVTLLPWVPESLILMEGLGIFPTLETIVAQVVFILAVIGTFMVNRLRASRPAESAQQPSAAK